MPLITRYGTMPIPEGFHINASDMRVYVYSATDIPVAKRKRISVGKAVDKENMYPNDTLREMKPDLWKKYFGDAAPLDYRPYQLSAGLYGATLAIGHHYGLYKTLISCYGITIANFLLDFAMYSISERSNTASAFQSAMNSQVIFSAKAWSDSWISDAFTKDMGTDSCDMFCSKWIDLCVSKGLSDAWICIDGSNCNCKCGDSPLPQEGKAKSKEDVPVVGYLYAVSDDGLPLAYTVFEGSKHDSTAVEEMITLLSLHGIKPKGVIIDRAFCSEEMIERLNKLDYPYAVMLKDNVLAYKDMEKLHAEDIRWKVGKAIGKKGCFGISEKRKIFSKSDAEGYVSFFFDGINAAERASDLIVKTKGEISRLQTLIGKEKKDGEAIIEPGRKYADFVKVETDGEGKKRVVVDEAAWQAKVDAKGFSAIATSKDFGPEETDRIYHLRDAVEKQFDTVKNELGYRALRCHSDLGIRNRLFACFIAAIIRSILGIKGKEAGIDTSRLLLLLKDIKLRLNGNTKQYVAIEDEGEKTEKFLRSLGLRKEDFANIADEYNKRDAKDGYPFRKLPAEREMALKKRGRPKKEKEPAKETGPKRKPGRPKGAKNKKTLEREAAAKRGPGRPKGSRNKKTLEKETTAKRGPGRPKGSKNKPKNNELTT